MPTNEWFQENPKISAYISKELHQDLEKWMEERGIRKVSQAISQILEEYFKLDQSRLNQSNPDETRIEVVEKKVEKLFQMIARLEKAFPDNKSSLKVDQIGQVEISSGATISTKTGQALTTGEAYEILRTRGLSKSINTFRRWVSASIETNSLPEELTQYGLQADFEVRRAANPKDNRVRWLFLS